MSESTVQHDRLEKLAKISALGVDPYGGKFADVMPSAAVRAKFDAAPLPQGEKSDYSVRVAGRILLYRDIGKLIFMTIQDAAGKIQVGLSKRELDEAGWSLTKLLDLGDIIGVEGPMGLTKTGELTVWGCELTLLSKSLLPPPEKWHGLTDVELRYRQRYVDLFANFDVAETFRKRSKIIECFRRVLAGKGFIEVETPVLQPLYGGGAARPFTTHHNTLDADLYLRISPELYLKRLLVGGLDRVFEIGRNFRNEGIDTRHNPEFTMMELYQAYGDYHDMMDVTEELIVTSAREVALPYFLSLDEVYRRADAEEQQLSVQKHRPLTDDERAELMLHWGMRYSLARALPYKRDIVARIRKGIDEGQVILPFGDRVLDLTPPWRRATYDSLLVEHAGVSMRDPSAIRAKAKALGLEPGNKDDAVVINEVFELTVEPALARLDSPTFVIDYPADICPLTRRKADDPTIALRFEVFIAGMEIGNAYTELNDPAVQEANFRKQVAGEGDAAAMRMLDEDFLTAMRHGMPPAGGLGIGIDRVMMLLTSNDSIRDVIPFPFMRPEGAGGQSSSQ